jgi:hypothetical protein
MLAGNSYARSNQVQKIEMMAEQEKIIDSDSESESRMVAKVRPPRQDGGIFKPTDLLQSSGNKNSILGSKTAEFSDQFRSKNAYDSGANYRQMPNPYRH